MVMNIKDFLFGALGVGLLATVSTGAVREKPDARLGTVEFSTSARSPEAQSKFIRGLLLLHNFEYPEAAAAFREAQKIEPDFAMAYWGEAMTDNHPIWNQRDAEAARAVLGRLGATPEQRLAKAPTERERGYLTAVETLYGEGEKADRDRAYADAMGALHEQFPKDDDASLFYALALLGKCEGERNVPVYEQAGAIAEEVFARRPDHPGAAHYVIHSFDDPAHAERALPAARAYSKIAPSAEHALHMPSHIFLALGMWDDVIASNEASWKASRGQGYHALWWLQYAQLQEGRTEDARRSLRAMVEAEKTDKSVRAREHLARMRAAQIVETEGRDAEAVAILVDHTGLPASAVATDLFATAFAQARSGEVTSAWRTSRVLGLLASSAKEAVPEILEAELRAELFAARGSKEMGMMNWVRSAAEKADALPYGFGPPEPVKPIHELWADLAFQFSRNEEARDQYRKALERAPKRRLSAEGLRKAEERLKAAGS